ncbi:MAG: TonB-dependent receptor, partial [Saprospiraceae bacterium]|nr:TonB-dependent receptor [Saprospiraceae bacterium]
TLPKVDFFVAGEVSQTNFWRTGNVRNGKFPDNSFGDSEEQSFFNYGTKAGVTYKLDGRNYFSLGGMYKTRAPYMRNALVSPRTRNQFVADLKEETIMGGEATYRFTAPYFKARLTGYYTQFNDQTLSRSFYHDDERSFVNLSLTGIDKEHVGIEAAAEATVIPGLKVHGVAAVGQYIFKSRPTATISQDNNAALLQENVTVYARNFYVSGTPQSAYTLGWSYNSKHYWSVYLNFNYFDNVWIDFNPVRRTANAVDLVEENSPLWNSILHQEKTPSAFTMNLSVFKSWLIDWFEDNVYFNLSLSVNNMLDNQDFITGGYEQLRFDFEGKDVDRFPSRYYYFSGLNYYLNASIRF